MIIHYHQCMWILHCIANHCLIGLIALKERNNPQECNQILMALRPSKYPWKQAKVLVVPQRCLFFPLSPPMHLRILSRLQSVTWLAGTSSIDWYWFISTIFQFQCPVSLGISQQAMVRWVEKDPDLLGCASQLRSAKVTASHSQICKKILCGKKKSYPFR